MDAEKDRLAVCRPTDRADDLEIGAIDVRRPIEDALRGTRNSRGVCCTCELAVEYRRLASWTKDRAAEAPSAHRRAVMVNYYTDAVGLLLARL